MRYFLILILVFFIVSCNSSDSSSVDKVTKTTKKEKFVPDMYVASEMTILMRNMYDDFEILKKEINMGETPKKFPKEYVDIVTAKLTDNKPQNEIFKAYSKVYIENVEALFDSTSKISVKDRFNAAVNTCISCHTTECVGPIPRIEKLVIK